MTLSGRLRDERGILGTSVIRWLIVIVLFGLVVVEGASIIFTTIGLQNATDGAASAAAAKWEETHDIKRTRQAAEEALDDSEQDEAKITELEADNSPPYEVRMTVTKQASTLLVHRIGFLKDLATVEVHGKASAVESNV